MVEGGSRDGSLEFLQDWVERDPKLKILSSDLTFWGEGDQFGWPQIIVNRQVGFEALTTDWAIHVDADHVMGECDVADLRLALESCADQELLSFPVWAFSDGERSRTQA